MSFAYGRRFPVFFAFVACFSSPAFAQDGQTLVLGDSKEVPIATSWTLERTVTSEVPIAYGLSTVLPAVGAAVQLPATEERSHIDALSNDEAERLNGRYGSFVGRVGAVKWEAAGIFALLTATNIGKVIDEPQSFHFQDEGFFGKNTADLGVDKLAHSYNSYLISEILYRRMQRKTGGGRDSAITAAALGFGLQAYGEIYDGLHAGSGFSLGDVGFNLAGAVFSAARNSIPGLQEKLDFRIMIVPNHDFYTREGKEHFEQEHFLLALKLAGFDRFHNSPLRFLELHVGYHAKDFTIADRLAGVQPKRLPFVGFGFNFSELFLKQRRSAIARSARTVLEYFQVPYTAVHLDLPTGRLSP